MWPRTKRRGVLGIYSTSLDISKPAPLVRDRRFFRKFIKANTSKWAKQLCASFAWQEGYTAFTVSESQLAHLRRYIRDQEKHHRKMSFQEELAKLLKAHRMKVEEE